MLYTRRENNFTVVFNKRTGDKFRVGNVSFGATYRPEALEIKITDYCSAGCPFCYMGSSTEGKHAHYYFLERIIHIAKKLGVFEIVLGGGEPLAYPQFKNILELCKNLNLTVNFSTRQWGLLKDWWHLLPLEYVSQIGVSIQSEKEMLPFGRSWDVTYQVIPGIVPLPEVEKIIAAGRRTLLLGQKENPAGITAPLDLVALWEIIERYPFKTIVLDTLLFEQLKESHPELESAEVEGVTSKYIDAVNLLYGKASYEPENLSPIPMLNPYRIDEEKFMGGLCISM